MSQNIGELLGKIVGKSICKSGGCKSIPVRSRVVMYSKPGKKPMPQPAYTKQAAAFSNLLAAGAMSSMQQDDDVAVVPKRKTPTAKKIPARGPIRGTMVMRRGTRKKSR